MSEHRTTYTKEVEKEKVRYTCDGPGEEDDEDGCTHVGSDLSEFNIIMANARAQDNVYPQLYNRRFVGKLLTTVNDRGRKRGLKADAEVHYCDDCYEKLKPLLGLEPEYTKPEEKTKIGYIIELFT